MLNNFSCDGQILCRDLSEAREDEARGGVRAQLSSQGGFL